MLFGKNSDRQRNEAQVVEFHGSADHPADAQLACTYRVLPQAQHTHAVLLCRPFWMWGAEMGANEHGVVIGNEAVRARSSAPEEPALTGMDLLRLGLERGATATEALEIITALLGRYGQGGNCGHLTPSYYNNSFVITDAVDAFVLETVGKEWLVERVAGVRSISNRYSIGRRVDRTSSGLAMLVRDSGWSSDAQPMYSEAIADTSLEHLGNAGARHACSTALLQASVGRLNVAGMMRILRDHGTGEHSHTEWRTECIVQRTLCMHAGAEDRPGQTVGSMVSELAGDDAIHWVTGTAAPCMSIFKPVLLNVPLPAHGPSPTDRFDPRTLWWRHEQLHRSALHDAPDALIESMRIERDSLEASFEARIRAVLNGGNATEQAGIVAACWQEALEAEGRWLQRVGTRAMRSGTSYDKAWEEMNLLAGLELPGVGGR
jgi:dipeptidase